MGMLKALHQSVKEPEQRRDKSSDPSRSRPDVIKYIARTFKRTRASSGLSYYMLDGWNCSTPLAVLECLEKDLQLYQPDLSSEEALQMIYSVLQRIAQRNFRESPLLRGHVRYNLRNASWKKRSRPDPHAHSAAARSGEKSRSRKSTRPSRRP